MLEHRWSRMPRDGERATAGSMERPRPPPLRRGAGAPRFPRRPGWRRGVLCCGGAGASSCFGRSSEAPNLPARQTLLRWLAGGLTAARSPLPSFPPHRRSSSPPTSTTSRPPRSRSTLPSTTTGTTSAPVRCAVSDARSQALELGALARRLPAAGRRWHSWRGGPGEGGGRDWSLVPEREGGGGCWTRDSAGLLFCPVVFGACFGSCSPLVCLSGGFSARFGLTWSCLVHTDLDAVETVLAVWRSTDDDAFWRAL